MGPERADADEVDTGCGDRGDAIEAGVAACFDESAAGDLLHANAEIVEREVVEQDRVDLCCQHGLDLVEAVDFDFHVGGVRQTGLHGTQGLGNVAGNCGEVIVLDQHSIRE